MIKLSDSWKPSEVSEAGRPQSYAGVGTGFNVDGRAFIVVAQTSDDLIEVMASLEWTGECDPDGFMACQVAKP